MLLGVRDDVRTTCYQQALMDAGHRPARLLDYRELVRGEVCLDDVICNASLVRIESPGRDQEVYRALLDHGYDLARSRGAPVIEPSCLATRAQDKGELLYPTQFFHGFERLMMDVAASLRSHTNVMVTSHPDDIRMLYDKRRCHQMLSDAAVPVARGIATESPIGGYDDLRDAMTAARVSRVFVKLRYGSSGAGVVAYQTAGTRELAITTVELVRRGDGTVTLYNNRRLHRYESTGDVRLLIDSLSAQGVHVEAWIPKASVGAGICDLRVLMIAGEPRHMVLRRSRSPITNLHLLNERCEADALRRRMAARAWDSMMTTCQRVASLFPRTLHLGIDLAVKVGLHDHAVLEVNAFGDLLKGVIDRGQTTYAVQIQAIRPRLEAMA